MQKNACIMFEELECLPQSSKYDLFNQGDVPSQSLKGPKHKRCQARRQQKEHNSEVCKVGDMNNRNWKNTEIKSTIESFQGNLTNGYSKVNSSEELLKCFKKSNVKSKSATEITAENRLSSGYSKILLENGPSELSRVIQKRIRNLKALDNRCLESDTISGDVEKAGKCKISEVPSKTGCLELSWPTKHFAWQSTCHKTTAGSKENSTDMTRISKEREITILSDVRAVEPTAVFEPVNAFIFDEPKGRSESWEQKVSELTHLKTCISQFACARTTPISLNTCARIRPFGRSKLCTKFWFCSAWFCKQGEMGEQHYDAPNLKAKSRAESYQGLHCKAASNFESNQGYLKLFENVVYLFAMLSLDVPELKQVNKNISQEKAILKNDCSCASFEQDQGTHVQPPEHFSVVIEHSRVQKVTHDNAETFAAVDVPNSSKMTHDIIEQIKCPIRKSEWNLINISAHLAETIELMKRPEVHIPLCNATDGHKTLNCQEHQIVWDKTTSSKGCLEQINDVQPVVNLVYQNESAVLRCQLDIQCHHEPNEQTESEGFDAVCPILTPENIQNKSEKVGENYPSLFVSLCPANNDNIENLVNFPWKEIAQGTSSLENHQELPSSREPFIIKQAREDNEFSCCKEEHFVQEIPDIIRAYKEDALVLDVIEDDPDLFGSSSSISEVVQEERNCIEMEVESVDDKLANEHTYMQREDSDDRITRCV